MFGDLFRGMFSVLTVTAAPQLYRYPHRTNSEALKGDMKRIGGDIQLCMDKLTNQPERESEQEDDYGESR